VREVLVFDLDDTLYPEREYALSGFRAVGEWVRDAWGAQGFYAAANRAFEEGVRGTVFNRALEALGLAERAAEIPTLVEVFRGHAPDIRLHDDGAWAIDHFKRECALAILTDGYLVTQQRKVAALGLESRFELIIYTDAFGREAWKPSEVPYRAVMEHFSVDGARCTYVGDNPAKDFVAARGLGWRTIQIVRADGEYRKSQVPESYRADTTVTSLYALEKAL